MLNLKFSSRAASLAMLLAVDDSLYIVFHTLRRTTSPVEEVYATDLHYTKGRDVRGVETLAGIR